MTTNKHEVATRIAESLNDAVRLALGGNGKLVFAKDGSGGAWYSDNTIIRGDYLIFRVPWKRVTVQEIESMLGNI